MSEQRGERLSVRRVGSLLDETHDDRLRTALQDYVKSVRKPKHLADDAYRAVKLRGPQGRPSSNLGSGTSGAVEMASSLPGRPFDQDTRAHHAAEAEVTIAHAWLSRIRVLR